MNHATLLGMTPAQRAGVEHQFAEAIYLRANPGTSIAVRSLTSAVRRRPWFRYHRVNGIRFLRVGRINVQWSVARK